MAKINMDIGALLSVNKDMAEFALKLVQSYCNNNGVDVVAERNEDMTISYYFSHEKWEKRLKEYYGIENKEQ